MATYSLRTGSPAKTRADAVVVGVIKHAKGVSLAPGAQDVAAAYGRRLQPLFAHLGVTGKVGEVVKVPTNGAIASGLLVLVGLGTESGLDPAVVRRAAGAAARAGVNAAAVALALPDQTPEHVAAAVTGWQLGSYTFTSYKRDTAAQPTAPGTVIVLAGGARRAEFTAAFAAAQVVAEAVAGTRDWVNTPPNDQSPAAFAQAVQALHKTRAKGRKSGLTLRIHDEAALAELGCGGILAVGNGSAAPPRLIELDYRPAGATAHLALVGKGITFDSGGLTIKPANGMVTMKFDMAGAAAVLQATYAIAALGLPIAVSTFAPMAENMLSGTAMRPGDVITTYSGRTVEVTNTDAEGRLVLIDALSRAVEAGPDVIVDVATLTGHMITALGDRIGAIMGSSEVIEAVRAAGDRAGETHWPMPIPEEMDKRIAASKLADVLQHDWVRWGGGLFAGAFLREFTGGLPWAHLDIAGPAFNSGGPHGHLTSGGTGFATATLVEYARQLCDGAAPSAEG